MATVELSRGQWASLRIVQTCETCTVDLMNNDVSVQHDCDKAARIPTSVQVCVVENLPFATGHWKKWSDVGFSNGLTDDDSCR